MRFLLTAAVWVVIVGGLWSYSQRRSEAEANIIRTTQVIESVEERYALKLTPTFSVEKDPFALVTEDSDSEGVKLSLNGKGISVESEQLQRGVGWQLERVEGLVVGANEIYLEASPPVAESMLSSGVRVQLYKSGVAVVDQTLWGEQGALVTGTILFELETEDTEHDH